MPSDLKALAVIQSATREASTVTNATELCVRTDKVLSTAKHLALDAICAHKKAVQMGEDASKVMNDARTAGYAGDLDILVNQIMLLYKAKTQEGCAYERMRQAADGVRRAHVLFLRDVAVDDDDDAPHVVGERTWEERDQECRARAVVLE